MKLNGMAPERPAPNASLAVLVSGALWLVAVLLTIISIFAIREIILWGLGFLLIDPQAAHNYQAVEVINLAHQCLMMVLGIAALGLVIYVSESFFAHAGQPRLLRTLGRIVAVEFGIVLLVALLFWRT
ncbi:MAG: hypothetical protein K8I30_23190 [Anaerolineae bacterium]|nr:hypothetical protein [Anaerolineae bacterium]